MSKTLERMLLSTGKSAADYRANSKLGELHRRAGVKRTAEFLRILALPQRDWRDVEKDGYLETLSAFLRAPGGTQTLRAQQAAILTDLYDGKGALGQLGIGDGKTHVTALAATILGEHAQRPLLITPGGLRNKTARDFKVLRQHWRVHPRLECISYEQLGRKTGDALLASINPDFVVADEAQRFKNLRASCTKKFKRWMRNHPETIFLPLSATFMKRSIRDVWHLLLWALKPERMPLPLSKDELAEWALAVDEKVKGEGRVAPGALLDFLVGLELPPDATPLMLARMALQHRIGTTPGVVVTKQAEVEASLSVELIKPPPSEKLDQALKHIRESGEMLDGDIEVKDPKDRWRYLRQTACGFYYRWVPEAPDWWLIPRRNWHQYTRHVLEESTKLDSPQQVRLDVESGRLTVPFRVQDVRKPGDSTAKVKQTPQDILRFWLGVDALFKPKKVVHWIDDSYLRWILKKYVHGQAPTILWVEHIAVGEKLAELSGLPFCHRKGLDEQGRFIEDLSGSLIASIFTCGDGFNLQYKWARNVVVSAPPNGVVYEQMMGRTFRTGQVRDEVEFFVLNGSPEQEASFEQAVRDAHFQHQTTGTMQRLILADRV
jgi:hypothetical protein